MPEQKRWVVIAPDSDELVGGPYLWDGVTDWTPPESGWLVPEEEWLARQPARPAIDE